MAFRGAHVVMGTGQPALDTMQTMGCPKKKLVNFPHFVEPADFSVRKTWFDGNRPLEFVSAGRLVPEKGYSTALKALAKVFAGKNGAFRYRLMGAGPELANLSGLAESLGISSRVEFLGWLDPPESRAVLETSDIFLHPCQFEPFGVVIAEAMAAGLVVIASNSTAAAVDRIENGVNGFLYETSDIASLCDAILHLREHPQRIEPAARCARVTAEKWPLTRAVEIVQEIIEPVRGIRNSQV
jgi:glycosyltransferase involved in cell wall biosynthesis